MTQLRDHYQERLLFLDTGDLLFEKETTRPAVEKCQDDARIEPCYPLIRSRLAHLTRS